MNLLHLLALALSASPLITYNKTFFFPYAFLGFTLFLLALLAEQRIQGVKVLSVLFWLGALFMLFLNKPLGYQICFSGFMATQTLNYGFRSSRWFVQLFTLTGFFAFLLLIFVPLAFYVGLGSLVVLVLAVKPVIFPKNND